MFCNKILFFLLTSIRIEISQSQKRLFDHFGVQEVFAGAVVDGAAGLEDIAAVGEFEGFANFLLNEKNRFPGCLQFGDGLEHLIHQFRHETQGRFIKHEKLWAGHQAPSDGQHLLLSAGKGPAELKASLFQPGKR